MLPTNYDLARMRVEDWHREADHARLVREAKAARKASQPERPGVLAATRSALAATSRVLPWKRGPHPQASRLATPAPLASVQPAARRA
jgi:hypothetical protein